MGNAARYEMAAAQAMQSLAQIAENARDSHLRLCRNVLNGGEISPEMAARLDQQRYNSGFHELVNFIPLETGGIRRRPGLEHLGWALGASSRLIPFIFSSSQSGVLEFCRQGSGCTVRFWDQAGKGRQILSGLPFTEEIIRGFSYAQSADVIFLAHEDMRPCKISRYGDDDWRFEEIQWKPSIEAPEFLSLEPTGAWPENEWGRVRPEYVVTAIDKETGQESIASKPVKLAETYPLSQNWYVLIRVKPQEDASEFRIYKKEAGVFGFIGRITEADEENGDWRLEDRNIAPDTEDTPPDNRDPFEEDGERPSLVFLHQQRLGYAASKKHPLTFWLSQSGNFESMAASVPPNDDDAIEASLAAPQANKILWAISDRSGLAFGTEGGEWLMAPSEGAALSPKDISFQPQSSYGSEPGLPALRAANSLLFAQRGAKIVRDLSYSFSDDRYNATDLSIIARHITSKSRFVSLCWQQEPGAILWGVLNDGTLAALTYLKEHEVMAWHRHNTQGKFLCCAAIPGPDGNWLAHFVVERQGKISIERLRAYDDPEQSDGADHLPYESIAIPTTPEINGQDGTSLGIARKIAAVKLQMLNSWPCKLRVLGQKQGEPKVADAPPRARAYPDTAFWNVPLNAGFLENPRLKITATQPVTILSIHFSMELSDGIGNQ